MNNILIVDDDRHFIQHVRRSIADFGHASDFITRAERLFPKLERDGFDLILLDIHMPGVDGVSLLRRLKAHPDYRSLPVIMLTVEASERTLADCFEYGAADFIAKPVQELVLKARLQAVLDARRAEAELKKHRSHLEELVEERTAEVRKGNQKLRQLRNFLSNIIDSMPSILIGVDAHCNVTQWNKSAERATGITADAARGAPLPDVYPQMASERENITESIWTGEIKQERRRPGPAGSGDRCEDVTIYPLIAEGAQGAVIRIDDVTKQVRMEEMMIQGEKMLTVGGLAAGMAHEINNPLAGVIQTVGVMASRLNNIDMPANKRAAARAGATMKAIHAYMKDRGIPGMMTTINESGRRMAEIVHNMLSFARKSDAKVSSHALGELLDKTLELAAGDYDLKKQYDFKKIEIRREYEDNLPPTPCEGAKIQQVLLNILRNGAQAMQEAGTETPMFFVRMQLEEDREMIRVEIEDNGPGMDETTRKRVFEPFFTTKPVGEGTGLGLSVSYFIITEDHGGEMAVESRPGAGARFIIRLPL